MGFKTSVRGYWKRERERERGSRREGKRDKARGNDL